MRPKAEFPVFVIYSLGFALAAAIGLCAYLFFELNIYKSKQDRSLAITKVQTERANYWERQWEICDGQNLPDTSSKPQNSNQK